MVVWRIPTAESRGLGVNKPGEPGWEPGCCGVLFVGCDVLGMRWRERRPKGPRGEGALSSD